MAAMTLGSAMRLALAALALVLIPPATSVSAQSSEASQIPAKTPTSIPTVAAGAPQSTAPSNQSSTNGTGATEEQTSDKPTPDTAGITTTLSGTEIQSLPASGRRWEDFTLDTPAAAAPVSGSEPALHGSGTQPADTTIDGASIRLAFGQVSSAAVGSSTRSSSAGQAESPGMGRPWSGGHGFAISEAAIRQVQTIASNVEAAGARAAGGRTSLETLHGTNGLHGQAFVFDRQNTWGARNPFTQWIQQTAPATATTVPSFTPESYTPSDHEVRWGLASADSSAATSSSGLRRSMVMTATILESLL